MRIMNKPARSNEAAYYVPYGDIDVYCNKQDSSDRISGTEYIKLSAADREKYQWNETLSQNAFNTFKKEFAEKIQTRYKSMKFVDDKVSRKQRILTSSDAFDIILEESDWALDIDEGMFAVRIKRKTKDSTARQRKYIHSTRKALRDILLEMTPVIYVRTGDFTANSITKQKALQIDREEVKTRKAVKVVQEKATENAIRAEEEARNAADAKAAAIARIVNPVESEENSDTNAPIEQQRAG